MTTRKRIRIQFGLRTLLLSVTLVALLLFAWRWFTWPERTLRELDAQVQNNTETIRIRFIPDYRMSAEAVSHQLKQYHTTPKPRSVPDIFAGRQIYQPANDQVLCWVQIGSDHEHVLLESITIERGTITYRWGQRYAEWLRQSMPERDEENEYGLSQPGSG
ncbi:MAG: hypothetical protein KDB05_27815 [Planctomycetales bacterium]|nr:hypothetical protein [Planctomycetales bacterium]